MKKALLIIGSILAVIIIALVLGGVWLYHGTVSDSKESVFTKLPFPAAKVGSTYVAAKDVFSRYHLVVGLQPNGATTSKATLEQQVLDKFITDAKLKIVATQHGVTPSDSEVSREYQAVVDQLGGGDPAKFKADTLDKYHLSVDEFKKQVLAPNVLYAKLNTWYNAQSSLNPSMYDTLKQAQAKLDSGQDFAAVAKEFSQDSATKDLGGDAGFLGENQLLPEFADVVNSMNKGDTKTIPSRYGVHIVKFLDRDTLNNQKRVHLQQIFLSNTGFEKWLGDQTKSIPTKTYLHFS